MKRFCAISFTLVWLMAWGLSPSIARAQEPGDKAAAEALFQLAQRAMADGKYAEACPRLEASAKLDPGVGTLLFLGDCQEKLGKLASSWATFREAMALASSRGDTERASVAELRATALRPRLSHVIYVVDPRNDMPGFELRRNGTLVSQGSWGLALPSDAGSYQLEATAPGYQAFRSRMNVQLDVAEPVSAQVPVLQRAVASENSRDGTEGPSSEPRRPMRNVEHASSAQKTWGVLTFSVGAALSVTSGVLALMATRKNSDSKGNCSLQDPNLCNPKGVTQRDDAKQLASLATILGIGGGAVLTTGAVLFLTAPATEHGAPSGLGIELHSRF
jgi:hypothetical protein